MVHRPVLLEQFRRAIPGIVWMGESKVDKEGIGVLRFFPIVQIVNHLLPVPVTAGFLCSATPGGVITHRELGVGPIMTIAVLAGAHGVVSGRIEDSGQAILDRIRDTGLGLLFPVFSSQSPEANPSLRVSLFRGATLNLSVP